MFEIQETNISDLIIIQPKVYGDNRGFFMESWNKRKFSKLGLNMNFVQDNHSKSQKGVLRGIHFQSKHSQGKMVRVIKGSVYDVAVDLRKESSTCGHYFGVILSEENRKMLYIPENFGHAFLTLSNEVEFIYKTTDYYYPEYDTGIIWNDPDINIKWPLQEFGIDFPKLSDKDRSLKLFSQIREKL